MAASSSSTSTSGLYVSSSAEHDVDMTLQAAIEASKDDADEALALLSTDHQPRELVTSSSSPQSVPAASSSANRPATTTAGGKAKASGSSNVSAVYRWYEGKLERKTCVRFSKSVTSNLWRHLKENHPDVYEKHRGEKKSVQMHRVMGVKKRGRKKKVIAPTPPAAADIEHDVGVVSKLQTEDGNGQSTVRPSAKKPKRGDHDTNVLSHYPLALHHQQKVREAMGYLCLYEMLPFELCSSHAFRNLMVECSGGAGGYVDDSNSFALLAKEIAFGYTKKMAAEVKVRTVMQMKMTDFSHLMLSEWRSTDNLGGNVTALASSTGYVAPRSDNDVTFLALFAGNSIVAKLAGDKELKKAMDRVVPCRYMPEILAVEPPSSDEVLTDAGASGSVGFRNRRLDKGEFIESSSAALTTDTFYGVSAEIASSILEELPTSLTGHTYRDLINKCSTSADSYERLFIDRLRDMAISLGEIHSVLSLVEDMMPALKQYFLVHKDSDSDFSKLIQLSCLSRYEWSRVRYLTVILKPFAEATTKLDSEQYVVSSLIVPSVFTLIEKLRGSHPLNIALNVESSGSKKSDGDVMEDLPEDIEALRDLAFVNLSTCFGHLFSFPEASWSMEKRHTFNLLWSATILDPRTRSFIIKGSLPQQEFWDIVKTEAANIAGTKMKDKENGNGSMALDEDSGHLDGNDVGKSTDLWTIFKPTWRLSTLEITKSSNLLEVEVSFFQEEGRIALRANPLEWWQNMRMKYPFLARLARYVLSIPCNVKVLSSVDHLK
ncbi:Ribonuclease H-like domain [Phytophthora cactorum]|nr:Ribonuclease H-like domain [Phytophthora cactorum]